jgi:hypothetical protein
MINVLDFELLAVSQREASEKPTGLKVGTVDHYVVDKQ